MLYVITFPKNSGHWLYDLDTNKGFGYIAGHNYRRPAHSSFKTYSSIDVYIDKIIELYSGSKYQKSQIIAFPLDPSTHPEMFI